MKASLKNYRQSPRKVRLVASLIKGKSATDAKSELKFSTKRASKQIGKMVDSAVANAVKNFGAKEEDLVVKEARVDKGITMHRMRAGARGRGFPLKKRTSNVQVTLEVKEGGKLSKPKKSAAKSTKTKVVKDKKADLPKLQDQKAGPKMQDQKVEKVIPRQTQGR